MIGKNVLHYKILSKLGEGGMGVVYKAQDTKLDREVALKFLPASQLGTGDDQQRFEQEAKAAAKLSHANIATVFEINEHEGQTFIAMEYVDGETLSEMVEKRPLKIKDAIKIAKQIAEGLHSAHEQGIVHRDIKSANVMITAKGAVKIMDFGLAKVSKASMVTKAGTTLGTISYMSPEQTQGEKVDHRSDIWSLGVVLYEMVSGQMPFMGDYESAIIYSIMNEEPEPLTAVRTGVPMDLEKIVNKLLAKDPGERYQNIVELPVDLKNVAVQESSTAKISSSVITDTISREKELNVKVKFSYKTLLTIAATVLATFLLTWMLKPGPPTPEPPQPHNVVISLLENTRHNFNNDNTLAVSPNGKNIVYAGQTADREFRGLFLKRERSFAPVVLDGTDRGSSPFFSPDGSWIGFINQRTNAIYKVSLSGGDPLLIVEGLATRPSSPTWASDNTIIFSDSVLKRMADSGGKPEVITRRNGKQTWHAFPNMLPDKKTILFTVGNVSRDFSDYRLAVYTFGDDDYRTILDEEGYNAVYSPSGHILYGRSNRLMAVAFDLENLNVKGTPAIVIQNVATWGWGTMSYDLSAEGTLAYVAGQAQNPMSSIVSIELSGSETKFFDYKKDFDFARFSPDGKYVAFDIKEEKAENIWLYHVDGDALNQLTFIPENRSTGFAWSPDSKTIAYASLAEDSSNSIYLRRIDGAGKAKKIFTSSRRPIPFVTDWSSDGRHLFFDQWNNESNFDIYVYSFADSIAKPLLSSPALEAEPDLSPNGKWLLFSSNESGVMEIYVRPFPETTDGIWKISNGGGGKALWSPDGSKIYYFRENVLYSVEVSAGEVFSAGNQRKLFEGTYFLRNNRRFDIHPDGDRFILIQRQQTQLAQQIFVIQNFDEELKRLVPVEKN